MMYFYLRVHQHVSASNPVIFRMMIQEYNCSYINNRDQSTHRTHVFRERFLSSPKRPHGAGAHAEYCQMTDTRYFLGAKSHHPTSSNAEMKKASTFLWRNRWWVIKHRLRPCVTLLIMFWVIIIVEQKRHFFTRLVNSSAHITIKLTKSVDQSPSWKPHFSSPSQEISPILYNPNSHHRIHKIPPLILTLIQIIQLQPYPIRSNLILSHLRPCVPSGLLSSSFPTKTLYAPLDLPIRATCIANPMVLVVITREESGEVC